jgi:hypothetical protein
MKKEEIIAKYGEAAYESILVQARVRYKAHPEEKKARSKKYREDHPEGVNARSKKYREEHRAEEKARKKKYREEHPEQVIANHQEEYRKGGRHYDKYLAYKQTGVQGDKNKIRIKHGRQYRPYKQIIAPESQIHHEWLPDSAKYKGVALVEKDAHMHGIVDVIEILDGEITVLTEEEIRKKQKQKEKEI